MIVTVHPQMSGAELTQVTLHQVHHDHHRLTENHHIRKVHHTRHEEIPQDINKVPHSLENAHVLGHHHMIGQENVTQDRIAGRQ